MNDLQKFLLLSFSLLSAGFSWESFDDCNEAMDLPKVYNKTQHNAWVMRKPRLIVATCGADKLVRSSGILNQPWNNKRHGMCVMCRVLFLWLKNKKNQPFCDVWDSIIFLRNSLFFESFCCFCCLRLVLLFMCFLFLRFFEALCVDDILLLLAFFFIFSPFYP